VWVWREGVSKAGGREELCTEQRQVGNASSVRAVFRTEDDVKSKVDERGQAALVGFALKSNRLPSASRGICHSVFGRMFEFVVPNVPKPQRLICAKLNPPPIMNQ
jgi:hypothetical protein